MSQNRPRLQSINQPGPTGNGNIAHLPAYVAPVGLGVVINPFMTLSGEGANAKLDIWVTATDTTVVADQNSTIIQIMVASRAGALTLLTANATSRQTTGGAGTFGADVAFSLSVASATTVALTSINVGAAPLTGRVSVIWTVSAGCAPP